MRQEIIDKFKEFEKELDKLKTANEHIQTSKSVAKKSLDLLEETSKHLIEHITATIEGLELSHMLNIEKHETILEDIKKNLLGYQLEVQKTTGDLFKNLAEPTERFRELAKKTESLVSKIDQINFPERLDDLEKSIGDTFLEILEYNKEVNKQAEELIAEINKINFSDLFNSLKETIAETVTTITGVNNNFISEISNHLNALIAQSDNLTKSIIEIEIPDRFEKLSSLIEKSIVEIKETNFKTQSKVETLTNEIKDINIQHRLDKLDATIAGITQSIQSVLQRFESLERNLKEGQQNKANEVLNLINSIEIRNKEFANQLSEKTTKSLIETLEKNQKEAVVNWKRINKENRILKVLIIITLALSAASVGVSFLI